MIGSYWIQIDLHQGTVSNRFYMKDCAGQDPAARAIIAGGWAAYEAPLPSIVVKLCRNRYDTFIDIGASTGFYSLLAAAAGARNIFACESDSELLSILRSNAEESRLKQNIRIKLMRNHGKHLATSKYVSSAINSEIEHGGVLNAQSKDGVAFAEAYEALSLNTDLMDKDISLKINETFIRIGVVDNAAKVLMGAQRLICKKRPVIAMKLMESTEASVLQSFLVSHGYMRFHLGVESQIKGSKDVVDLSSAHPYHLLLPEESISLISQILSEPERD